MDNELLAPPISACCPPKKLKKRRKKEIKAFSFLLIVLYMSLSINWVDLVIISSKLEIDSFFVPKLFVPNDYSSCIQSLHVYFPI